MIKRRIKVILYTLKCVINYQYKKIYCRIVKIVKLSMDIFNYQELTGNKMILKRTK